VPGRGENPGLVRNQRSSLSTYLTPKSGKAIDTIAIYYSMHAAPVSKTERDIITQSIG
jgi:hypothetical protein